MPALTALLLQPWGASSGSQRAGAAQHAQAGARLQRYRHMLCRPDTRCAAHLMLHSAQNDVLLKHSQVVLRQDNAQAATVTARCQWCRQILHAGMRRHAALHRCMRKQLHGSSRGNAASRGRFSSAMVAQ
jgi:hypothetical protein